MAEKLRVPFFEAEDLTIGFAGVKALNGVSVVAERGEVVGVIGPDGAGKTAIFNCIGLDTSKGLYARLWLKEPDDPQRAKKFDMLCRGVQLNSGPGGHLIFSYQMCRFDGTNWEPIGEALDAVKLGLAR